MIDIEGPLDRGRLEQAISATLRRHSIFRTAYAEVGGAVHQLVRPGDALPAPAVELVDLSALPAGEQAAAQSELVASLQRRVHDLSQPVVPDVRLLRLAPDRHALLVVGHHIVCDAISLVAFPNEIAAAYEGQPAPERPVQYIDYAHALVRWAESPAGIADRAYWSEQLATAEPITLPSDHPREPVERHRDAVPLGIVADDILGATEVVPAELGRALHALARRERVSLPVVYQAALALQLARETGLPQAWIVNTMNPRLLLHLHRVLAEMHGMVTTCIPVRIPVAGATTFQDLLRATSSALQDASEHCFSRVYEWAPHPLRRVMFNYVPYRVPAGVELGPELRGRRRQLELPPLRRQNDLHVNVYEREHDVQLGWLFARSLFRPESAQPYLRRYVELLHAIARTPAQELVL